MPTTLLDRLVVRMDGWIGGPGYMTFLGPDMIALRPEVLTFLNAIKINFPTVVTFTVPADGDIIRDSDGSLDGAWSTGTATTLTGGTAGAFAASVGACITWATGVLATGVSGRSHRLRGRTFLVPLHPVVFANDGTLTDATRTALNTAATNLAAGGHLWIRHRPTTTGGTDGFGSVVTGASVADKAAVLRSRRD